MSGWDKLSTATYSTKRNPSAVAGIGGASVTNLTALKCTPIMPAVSGTGARVQMPINSQIPGQVIDLWETYVEYQTHLDSTISTTALPDIRERDILVVGSTNYKVWKVEEWTATSTLLAYSRILLGESQ